MDFDKFVGKKVEVFIKEYEYKVKKYSQHEIKENDAVITEATEELKKQGMHLRCWLPDTIGTMDLRNDRVNFYIEEKEDIKKEESTPKKQIITNDVKKSKTCFA